MIEVKHFQAFKIVDPEDEKKMAEEEVTSHCLHLFESSPLLSDDIYWYPWAGVPLRECPGFDSFADKTWDIIIPIIVLDRAW